MAAGSERLGCGRASRCAYQGLLRGAMELGPSPGPTSRKCSAEMTARTCQAQPAMHAGLVLATSADSLASVSADQDQAGGLPRALPARARGPAGEDDGMQDGRRRDMRHARQSLVGDCCYPAPLLLLLPVRPKAPPPPSCLGHPSRRSRWITLPRAAAARAAPWPTAPALQSPRPTAATCGAPPLLACGRRTTRLPLALIWPALEAAVGQQGTVYPMAAELPA